MFSEDKNGQAYARFRQVPAVRDQHANFWIVLNVNEKSFLTRNETWVYHCTPKSKKKKTVTSVATHDFTIRQKV